MNKLLFALVILGLALNQINAVANTCNMEAGGGTLGAGIDSDATLNISCTGGLAGTTAQFNACMGAAFAAANTAITTINVDLTTCASFSGAAITAWADTTKIDFVENISVTIHKAFTAANIAEFFPEAVVGTLGTSGSLTTYSLDASAVFDETASNILTDQAAAQAYIAALIAALPADTTGASTITLKSTATTFALTKATIDGITVTGAAGTTIIDLTQGDCTTATVANGAAFNAATWAGGKTSADCVTAANPASLAATVSGTNNNKVCGTTTLATTHNINLVSGVTATYTYSATIAGGRTVAKAAVAAADFVGDAVLTAKDGVVIKRNIYQVADQVTWSVQAAVDSQNTAGSVDSSAQTYAACCDTFGTTHGGANDEVCTTTCSLTNTIKTSADGAALECKCDQPNGWYKDGMACINTTCSNAAHWKNPATSECGACAAGSPTTDDSACKCATDEMLFGGACVSCPSNSTSPNGDICTCSTPANSAAILGSVNACQTCVTGSTYDSTDKDCDVDDAATSFKMWDRADNTIKCPTGTTETSNVCVCDTANNVIVDGACVVCGGANTGTTSTRDSTDKNVCGCTTSTHTYSKSTGKCTAPQAVTCTAAQKEVDTNGVKSCENCPSGQEQDSSDKTKCKAKASSNSVVLLFNAFLIALLALLI